MQDPSWSCNKLYKSGDIQAKKIAHYGKFCISRQKHLPWAAEISLLTWVVGNDAQGTSSRALLVLLCSHEQGLTAHFAAFMSHKEVLTTRIYPVMQEQDSPSQASLPRYS